MPASLPFIIRAFEQGWYEINRHGYPALDDDGITIEMLERAMCYDMPEIIEDRPDLTGYGSGCLILAWITDDEPVHFFIGYNDKYVELVTAYRPNLMPEKWERDFRARRAGGN
ncbi:MAG TPA: DUF4258 domain-containing protein [Dehalococcoidia bacterium]|nr:DUF4258 domain-containing protein [Dehalococcoidia bacterium]